LIYFIPINFHLEFALELSVSQLLSQNKANCSLSAFDKENSIEFPLDFLYYIYNYYVAILISYGLHVTCQLTSLSYAVTIMGLSYNYCHTFFYDSVTVT